jgi:lipopolysaccharide transport system ATP-binding protein
VAAAITAHNVSKRYRLGQRESYGSLREVLMKLVRAPFAGRRANGPETLWALKDVDFEIGEHQAVGLIGRNGAGKSTLLKILSRITEPTTGEISINGRVGALLEVGTGFHPELSGRDNIFLNGALLGMRRTEIKARFDQIVAFAEIDRFIDTAVKHYSSGMYMRLAFAVAAHLEPEILLVDEVLAVGDAAFQQKCLGKMNDVAHAGRTVVFVSHNMGAINSLCSRVLWIDKGTIREEGVTQTVVSHYLESVRDGFVVGGAKPEDKLVIDRVLLKNGAGEITTNFKGDDELFVEVHYTARQRIPNPHFFLAVMGPYGPLFTAAMMFDGQTPAAIEGSGVFGCRFWPPFLLPQTYTIVLGARAADGTTNLMQSKYDVAFFSVIGLMREYGFPGQTADAQVANSTSMIVPYEWHMPDGSIRKGRQVPRADPPFARREP